MKRLSETAQWVSVGSTQALLSVARTPSTRTRFARLVLLHGNPADMDDWSTLARALPPRLELLAIDLPGFGRSQAVATEAGATALDTAADCVRGVLARVGWDTRVFVVGHSHGAAVAQVLAARHPESIAGLILVASLGVPAHAAYRQLAFPGMPTLLKFPGALVKFSVAEPLMRHILRGIMRPMFEPAPLPEALVQRQLDAFVARPSLLGQMAHVARGNPCAQLARDATRIGAPVLFIHGAQDRLVPLAHAQSLSALLAAAPSVGFETVPAAGHMLHITHALPVAELIGAWLSTAMQRLRASRPEHPDLG